MQFLAPWIWISALAISIPVILHLTRKESKNPTQFSSLMFFHKIPLQEFRRRRLRNLLLLALRCLAVFFLVAAFSQPVLTNWLAGGIGRPARSTLILVDNSLSMSRPDVWEKAKTAVFEEIDQMTRQDETLLAHFGLSNGTLTRWQSNQSVLRTAARDHLNPSAGSTSYAEGLRFASLQFEESGNPNRRIVLITDLQKSGIDQAALTKVNLPAGVSIEIQDVGQESRNFFVSNMQIEREIFSDTYLLPITVQVSGPQDEEISSELRLYLEEELIHRAEFSLSGNGPATVQFNSFELPEGLSRGKVVIGLKDDLAEDDVYHFVIERREPFLVQLLSGNPEESNYFKEALESGENLPFRIQTVGGTGQFKDTSARVIVLDDPVRIPAKGDLESFVRQGGGLILAHGRIADPKKYRPLQELLPGMLSERRFARSFETSYVFLDNISWDHPLFSIFEGSRTHLLDSIQYYGYWGLDPVDESRILARFNTGDPALLERDFENGGILQLATSLGRSWTDFPLRSAYVPFWHQVVRHSARWYPKPDSYLVSDLIDVSPKTETEDDEAVRDWEVLDPSGRRILSLGETSPDTIRFESPGFYEIRRDRETDWLAVNINPLESDLNRAPKETLLNLLPLDSVDNVPRQISVNEQETYSQPVWWLFVLLSALLFLSEALYSNWQRKRRDQLT